jgi:translation initiation factor 1
MRLFEGTPFDIPPKCDHCGLLEKDCKCPPEVKSRIEPRLQTAHLRIEKRKKGKSVTVISGLAAVANDFPSLVTNLKNLCGAGGTIVGDTVEIQGEHLAKIRDHLLKIGYRVK